MSDQCDEKLVKFKQGETVKFRLFLKKKVNGVLSPWVFPAVDSDISKLTLTMPGKTGTPVVFDFDNGVTAPSNEAITIESAEDRSAAAITVTLSKAQSETVAANDEGCPNSMEVFVDQTLNSTQQCKFFAFIEKLDVGKSLFS